MFCFFYVFIYNPALRVSRQKTNVFSVFEGYNIGWKRSFAPRKWFQIGFKAIKGKKSVQKKMPQSVTMEGRKGHNSVLLFCL